MAVLTQSGLERGDFGEGAASFRNSAGHMRYKHPWCPKPDAPAILFLPACEGSLFDVDGGAHLDNVVGQFAMQALAMNREFSFSVGVLASRRFVPLTLMPAFLALLHTPLLIIVVGIVGASLPFHLPV